jgi:DNA repair protein RadD
VFAVGIDHAERLAEAFREDGKTAEAVHSDMDKDRRREALRMFDRGELQVLVSVGILTEGWDSPRVDCVVMCRPTMSPSLFVQMIGRGTRLCEGKDDLLILDLAENFMRHGDPSNPRVVVNKEPSSGTPPYKICPRCLHLVAMPVMVCPCCCWSFLPKEPKGLSEAKVAPRMVVWDDHPGQNQTDGLLLEYHVSRNGNPMTVMRIFFRDRVREVRYYLSFDPKKKGFFERKSRKIWRQLAGFGRPAPQSIQEAIERQDELRLPDYVTICKDQEGFERLKEIGD